MNILFLATFPIVPHIGGVQRVTDTLAQELIRRGHNVVFLCHSREHLMSWTGFAAPQYIVKTEGREDKDIAFDIQQITLRHQITHVINQTANKATITQVRNMPPNIKVVFCCHVVPFNADDITRRKIWLMSAKSAKAKTFKLCSLLFPSIYKHLFNQAEKQVFIESIPICDKYCFVSRRLWPRVLRHIPAFPIEKLTAINNPNSFPSQNTIIPYDQRENAIVWIGRLESNLKNLQDFLKVWKLFSSIHPEWVSYIVGDGNEAASFKELSRNMGLQNILFEGNQVDTSRYYKKCKLACITSLSESWCMVLTEAMTFGCVPVVMNTYSTLTEIIDNGINGIITQPTPHDMAKELTSIASSRLLWEKLSKNAKEKAQKYDVKKIASEWEGLLSSI